MLKLRAVDCESDFLEFDTKLAKTLFSWTGAYVDHLPSVLVMQQPVRSCRGLQGKFTPAVVELLFIPAHSFWGKLDAALHPLTRSDSTSLGSSLSLPGKGAIA